MLRNTNFQTLPKTITALGIAVVLGCFGGGDRKSVGAQPLMEVRQIFIPGPIPTFFPPRLEITLDAWIAEQQKNWEFRTEQIIAHQASVSRNTNIHSVESNPLPLFSCFLEDAYRAMQ